MDFCFGLFYEFQVFLVDVFLLISFRAFEGQIKQVWAQNKSVSVEKEQASPSLYSYWELLTMTGGN